MKTYINILFCLLVANSYSQELNIPTFTQYLGENDYVISPAYSGIGDNIQIRINGLTQWVGIKDAPDNQSLAVSGRLGQKSGFGAYLYNDRNGNTYQKGGKLSFAHHLILDYNTNKYLSFGMSFVMNAFEIDIAKFTGTDPSVINNRQLQNYNVDLSFLYRQKTFNFAVNANNVLNKDTNIFAVKEPNKLRNYSIYSSLILKRDRDSKIEIEPSAFLQYFESDGRSTTDLNLKVRYLDFEDYFWAGITYRFLNDQPLNPLKIGPMVGLKKNKFYFAYSYQITPNRLFNYNTGTHMVTVGIDVFQDISNCPCTQKFTKQAAEQ